MLYFKKKKLLEQTNPDSKFCCWTSEVHVFGFRSNVIQRKREFSSFLLRCWRWWTPSGRRNLWIWILSHTAASPQVTMLVGNKHKVIFWVECLMPPLKLCMRENLKSEIARGGFVECLLVRYDRDRQKRGHHCCHPEECWRNNGSL